MENENRNPGLLCKRGCGFFGASQYDGFCSKCFHEVSLYKQKQQSVAASPPTSQPKVVASDSIPTSIVTAPPTISVTAPQIVTNCSSPSSNPTNNATPDVPLVAPSAVPLSQSISTPVEESGVDSSSVAISIANKSVTLLANSEDKGLPHVLSAPAFSDGDLLSSSPCNSESSATGSDRTKLTPNRCAACRKKVGLTGFPCRCGGVFCSAHRYSDRHECKYDYQADAKRELSKANPVVAAAKVERI